MVKAGLFADAELPLCRVRGPPAPDAIREIGCIAHVRRKFVGIHRPQGVPIVQEAISWIAQLYAPSSRAHTGPYDRQRRGPVTHGAATNSGLAEVALQLITKACAMRLICCSGRIRRGRP